MDRMSEPKRATVSRPLDEISSASYTGNTNISGDADLSCLLVPYRNDTIGPDSISPHYIDTFYYVIFMDANMCGLNITPDMLTLGRPSKKP